MSFCKYRLILVSVLLASVAYGHGEDKPGPHGGAIRMPGGFHTELLSMGEGSFKVYLLDLEFKNPSVEKSTVALSLKGNPSKKASCQPAGDFFKCTFPEIKLDKGAVISVTASRMGLLSAPVDYQLPLHSGT